MPMMIVDDAAFNKELEKLSSVVVSNDSEPGEIVTSLDLIHKLPGKVFDIKRGRPAGSVEIPESIRALAAEEAINGTPNNEVAKAFGISASSVSAYKNDATSTASYDNPDPQLKAANDEVRDANSELARKKLSLALEHLTNDKIQEAKAKDIAGIAKDMSAIVKNLEPTGPISITNNQVLVYRPRQREEDEFDVISVNE